MKRYDVSVVQTNGEEGENEKTYFNRCGVGFESKSGKGINLKLDLFPNVLIYIQEHEDKPKGR